MCSLANVLLNRFTDTFFSSPPKESYGCDDLRESPLAEEMSLDVEQPENKVEKSPELLDEDEELVTEDSGSSEDERENDIEMNTNLTGIEDFLSRKLHSKNENFN